MATEYKCDICGKPATVHITKIIDGKKVKIHLCSECAEKASFDAVNISLDLFPKLKELEQKILAAKPSNPDSCPTCGASLSEIEKGARFSCPDCYAALGNRLFEILAQMHASTDHKGKSPKVHSPNYFVSIDNLRKLRDFEDVVGEELFDEEVEDALKDAAKSIVESVQPTDETPLATVKLEATVVPPAETEESLKKQLDRAISDERYEDAAKLRDKLKSLTENQK